MNPEGGADTKNELGDQGSSDVVVSQSAGFFTGGYVMRRSLLTIMVMTMLVASSASAYNVDLLYTNDNAMTHDAGTFGVRGDVFYWMADSAYDSEGEKQDFDEDLSWSNIMIPIDVYYSVMDQLEIHAYPTFVMYKLSNDAEGAEDAEGTGLTDTWITAKYMAMMDPMVTVRGGVKLNTGENEPDEGDIATGDGQMDIDLGVLLGMPMGSGQFDAAAGYRLRMEDDDKKKPGNEIHFMAGYTHFLSEMMAIDVAANGYFGSEAEYDGETWDDSAMNVIYVNPGFHYMMDSGMTLGVEMQYPLMGQNVPAQWGFSGYVSWGSM